MAGAGTAVNGLSATTVIAGTADTPLTGTNVRQKIGVNTMDITEAVSILMPYKATTFGDSRSGGQISVAEIIDLLNDKLKRQEDSRLIPRTPYHTKVAYIVNGKNEFWITDQCPECVERRELGIWDTLLDRHKKYCCRCGQAIDWSEYEGREQIDWDEYVSRSEERAKRLGDRLGVNK